MLVKRVRLDDPDALVLIRFTEVTQYQAQFVHGLVIIQVRTCRQVRNGVVCSACKCAIMYGIACGSGT